MGLVANRPTPPKAENQLMAIPRVSFPTSILVELANSNSNSNEGWHIVARGMYNKARERLAIRKDMQESARATSKESRAIPWVKNNADNQ